MVRETVSPTLNGLQYLLGCGMSNKALMKCKSTTTQTLGATVLVVWWCAPPGGSYCSCFPRHFAIPQGCVLPQQVKALGKTDSKETLVSGFYFCN